MTKNFWAAALIFITLDGVRPQEFFEKTNLPKFWKTYGSKALTYPNVNVANKHNISLPGYSAIFAGKETECASNDCARTTHETFPEMLVDKYKFPKSDVAAFTSWSKTPLAIEHKPGTIFVNAAFTPLTENVCAASQARVSELNAKQVLDRPKWEENRFDRYTWGLAMEYQRCNKPRFLYIGLNDTDDYGHNNNYPGHLGALRVFDDWITALLPTLKDTTVILSTDHGRGSDDEWQHHGAKIKGSEKAWMVVLNLPKKSRAVLPASETAGLTHTAIAKVVDSVLGLPSPALKHGEKTAQ